MVDAEDPHCPALSHAAALDGRFRPRLAYTLFGGLLPFWGTALVLFFVGRSQSLRRLFRTWGTGGFFAQACCHLAIPVMRRRVRRNAPVEHPGWFYFVALLCLAVILILFVSVTLIRLFVPEGLNEGAIIPTSFGLFGVSVTMGFLVELINNVRMTPATVQKFAAHREADAWIARLISLERLLRERCTDHPGIDQFPLSRSPAAEWVPFYVGSMDSADLVAITWADIRHL